MEFKIFYLCFHFLPLLMGDSDAEILFDLVQNPSVSSSYVQSGTST